MKTLHLVLLLPLTALSILSSCTKEKASYDKVGELVVSWDDSSKAFQAVRGDEQFIVFNGQELKTYEGVLPPVLSPDGKKVAYGAKRGSRWFYVVDGKEGRPYDLVQYGYFGKDGRNFAYEAKQGNQWRIVINEGEGPLYDEAGVWDFTPDQQLYNAKRNGKEFVVWKGIEGKPYDSVGEPKMSPSGRRLAYDAHQGSNSLVVVNGNEIFLSDYHMLSELEWSLDESQLSFVGMRKLGISRSIGKDRVVVNGSNGEIIRSELLTPGVEMNEVIQKKIPFAVTPDNLSLILSEIQLVPDAEGKKKGAKFLSVKQGSLFDQMGCQVGDFLLAVDGNAVDLNRGLESIFGMLPSAKKPFDLLINRNDKLIRLNIELVK